MNKKLMIINIKKYLYNLKRYLIIEKSAYQEENTLSKDVKVLRLVPQV